MLGQVTVLDQDAASWGAFLRDFPGAYRAFLDNRAALVKLQPYIYAKHPELRAQYDSLLARANTLAPKLATLKGIYDQLKKFFGAAANVYQSAVDATSVAIEKIAGGITAARRFLGLGEVDEELGLPPLVLAIGAGAAIATVGAVVYWIADAYKFAKRTNALQELEAKGYSAEQAAAAVRGALGDPDKPGAIAQTASTLLWLGGALGALWIFGPMIRDMLSSRRRLT